MNEKMKTKLCDEKYNKKKNKDFFFGKSIQ